MMELSVVPAVSETMNQVSTTMSDVMGQVSKATIKADKPSLYRLVRGSSGEINLEGGFMWWKGSETGVDWKLQDSISVVLTQEPLGTINLVIDGVISSSIIIAPPINQGG